MFDRNFNNIKPILARILEGNVNYKIEETEMPIAIGCLAAAIQHLRIITTNQ